MKALTIKEPWASLIIEGHKKYEFRSWKTNYRGKIYIHAGQTIEKEYLKKFDKYNITYSKGEIIGEAYITDCILVNKDFNNKLIKENHNIYGNNDHTNEYAWKLENIKKYKNKIKIKGQLGLWNYSK
ncbi:MAG: ASCH domain-containing protein [Tenericutes bacterium]|nr:ASCH domain-containing protein [Mycoplasmatota bacterium]